LLLPDIEPHIFFGRPICSVVTISSELFQVQVLPSEFRILVTISSELFQVQVLPSEFRFLVTISSELFQVQVLPSEFRILVTISSELFQVQLLPSVYRFQKFKTKEKILSVERKTRLVVHPVHRIDVKMAEFREQFISCGLRILLRERNAVFLLSSHPKESSLQWLLDGVRFFPSLYGFSILFGAFCY